MLQSFYQNKKTPALQVGRERDSEPKRAWNMDGIFVFSHTFFIRSGTLPPRLMVIRLYRSTPVASLSVLSVLIRTHPYSGCQLHYEIKGLKAR